MAMGCRRALCVLLVATIALSYVHGQRISVAGVQYPSLDGSANNKDNPKWGAANSTLARIQMAAVSGNATGANRPSPRAVSLALAPYPYQVQTHAYNVSYLLTGIGQLTSSETSLAMKGTIPRSIVVPPGDPMYYNFTVDQEATRQGSRLLLPYIRDQEVAGEPINAVTSFIDAGVVYGTSSGTLKKLRVGQGTGRLKINDTDDLPPYNNDDIGLDMKNAASRLPQSLLRASGNVNINQNPMQFALTTLFIREHNRKALEIESSNPSLSEEEVFQKARMWVMALEQHIVFGEYMLNLGIPLPPYKGYNGSANPTIDAFFTLVAYRYGHSTVNDVVLRLDDCWQTHEKGHLTLLETYYNPEVYLAAGIEPIIRGMIAAKQAATDTQFSKAVAGNLFGQSHLNGTDLVAINIQKARDHSIPDYNAARVRLGLPRQPTFESITNNSALAATLKQLYGSVDNIDAYVGGLAEPHAAGSHLGELFTTSIREQMTRTRDGDWWYYGNKQNKMFSDEEIADIERFGLRDLIIRNTKINDSSLPADIWHVPTTPPAGTCAAGGGGASGFVWPYQASILGGSAIFTAEPTDKGMKLRVESSSMGWLGIGVPTAGASLGTYMIDADIVAGQGASGGGGKVSHYKAVTHNTPIPTNEEVTNDEVHAEFEQGNGKTVLELERAFEAPNGNFNNIPRPEAAKEIVFLVARGQSNAFEFHGSNFQVIRIKGAGGSAAEGGNTMSPLELLGGQATDMAAARDTLGSGIRGRRTHGALMLSNFLFVLPLGAILARQVRSHWIEKAAVKGILFYSHIIMQVSGVVIATAGFVIAVKEFDVDLASVSASHGKIGVATLCCLYSQLLMGFARPPANTPHRRWRLAWAVAHNLLGNISIVLGAINCCIGIILFGTAAGESVVPWFCAFVAGIVLPMFLTRFLDSLERHAVSSKLDNPPAPSRTESSEHDVDENDWQAMGSRDDAGLKHSGGSFKSHPGSVGLTERALREHAAVAGRVEPGKDVRATGRFDQRNDL